MAEILIKNKPFFYEELDLENMDEKCLDKNIAKENLLLYKHVLEEHHVKFLLMHGTLLGAIRNHDFIDWDCDIDTYVYDEQSLIEVIPDLDKVGLKLCRVSSIEYTFIRKGVYIDAFLSYRHPNALLRLYFCKYQFGNFPKKYFRKSQKIDFLGERFEVPYNPKNILRYFYGKDWNVPKQNANSMNEARTFFKTSKILRIPYMVLRSIKLYIYG